MLEANRVNYNANCNWILATSRSLDLDAPLDVLSFAWLALAGVAYNIRLGALAATEQHR